jgi:ferredoxin-NADP reductase
MVGQYCFINIPEISQLAWHPFTISSVPGDYVTTHHIKATSPDEWTGRLLGIAQEMAGSTNVAQINDLVVNIDGPYGVPIDTSRYRNLLLIGGGIGITPVHAMYKYILQCTLGIDRWSYAQMKKVRLLWVCRSRSDVAAFEKSFREIQRYIDAKTADENISSGPLFSFTIFVTGSQSRRGYGARAADLSHEHAYGRRNSGSKSREKSNIATFTAAATALISGAFTGTSSKPGELPIKPGRPDLQSEILALSPWRMEALVFVCGPRALAEDAGKYAAMSEVDFKHETFAL